jgi:hypothetical protein
VTDSPPAAAAAAADPRALEKPGFAFTDPGCRSDLRLGALIVLGAVFLWLWWGPSASSRLYLAGAALLLWGVPLQAIQARRDGRPGYPWKLGLAMALGGGVMWPDLRYRDIAGGDIHVQEVAPLLLIAGAWILAWWPLARSGRAGTQAGPTIDTRGAGA